MKFYKQKTLDRIDLYYKKYDNIDVDEIVNDNKLEPLKNVLDRLDWDWISWKTHRFHGDLHFENILINETNNGLPFSLLDWRQNFGGMHIWRHLLRFC